MSKAKKQLIQGQHKYASRKLIEEYGQMINGEGENALIHGAFVNIGVPKEGWMRFMADLAQAEGYPYMPNGTTIDEKAIPFTESAVSKHFMHNNGIKPEVGRTHAFIFHNLPEAKVMDDGTTRMEGGKAVMVLNDFGNGKHSIKPFSSEVLSQKYLVDKLLQYSEFDIVEFDANGNALPETRKPRSSDLYSANNLNDIRGLSLNPDGLVFSEECLTRIKNTYTPEVQIQRRQAYENMQMALNTQNERSSQAKEVQQEMTDAMYMTVMDHIDEALMSQQGPGSKGLLSDSVPAYLAKKIGKGHTAFLPHRNQEYFNQVTPSADVPTAVNCLSISALKPTGLLAQKLEEANMSSTIDGTDVRGGTSLLKRYQENGDCLIAFSKKNPKSGEYSTVFQRISEADGGGKFYLKNQGLDGHFINIGDSVEKEDVKVELLVEGFATGIELKAMLQSDHKFAVLACGDANNLVKVAADRAAQTDRTIIVVADNDIKTQYNHLNKMQMQTSGKLNVDYKPSWAYEGNPGVTQARAAIFEARRIRAEDGRKGNVDGVIPVMPTELKREGDNFENVDVNDIGTRAINNAKDALDAARREKAAGNEKLVHTVDTPEEKRWLQEQASKLYGHNYYYASAYMAKIVNDAMQRTGSEIRFEARDCRNEVQLGNSYAKSVSADALREIRRQARPRSSEPKRASVTSEEIQEREKHQAEMLLHGIQGVPHNGGYRNLLEIDKRAVVNATANFFADAVSPNSPNMALAMVLSHEMYNAHVGAVSGAASLDGKKQVWSHYYSNPVARITETYKGYKYLAEQNQELTDSASLSMHTVTRAASASRGLGMEGAPYEPGSKNNDALAVAVVLSTIHNLEKDRVPQQQIEAHFDEILSKVKEASADPVVLGVTEAANRFAKSAPGYRSELKEYLGKMLDLGNDGGRAPEASLSIAEMPTFGTSGSILSHGVDSSEYMKSLPELKEVQSWSDRDKRTLLGLGSRIDKVCKENFDKKVDAILNGPQRGHQPSRDDGMTP